MSTTPLELDGSLGEGGGQILRSSLALSLLTGKPFILHNVRAGRPKPGLQPQHLQSVRAAAAIGQASVRGASLGSSKLTFEPGAVTAGSYRFDIGTAGATGLVLQTVYLPLILCRTAPSELTLIGGTHVKASPCFHFLDRTWLAYLLHFGLRLSLRMDRPGFYPRGGGMVHAFLQPRPTVHPFQAHDRDPQIQAQGFSAAVGLPESVARRQARRASYRLRERGLEVEFDEQSWEGGPGSVIALELNTMPAPTLFFALGERGKPAEKVADELVAEVIVYLDAGPALVDPHSADQIVLPLALAAGPSRYTTSSVTRHLTTNIAVIRKFIDRSITCEGEEGSPGVIRID
jgi:RNA 3'-terminal phosphate cyclase (ATP)